MHKALHPKDDIDGLYVSRKEERRLASIGNLTKILLVYRLTINLWNSVFKPKVNPNPSHFVLNFNLKG